MSGGGEPRSGSRDRAIPVLASASVARGPKNGTMSLRQGGGLLLIIGRLKLLALRVDSETFSRVWLVIWVILVEDQLRSSWVRGLEGDCEF